MAKTGRIPIKAAEQLAYDYDCPVIVVWALDGNGDAFCVTTYGKSKALCRHAADIGRKISQAIMGGDIVPSQEEPTDLPNVPAVWKGER